ncbi:MAG: hypothetical protein QW791_06520 [Candidatus Bathyarchaeia archaeon]
MLVYISVQNMFGLKLIPLIEAPFLTSIDVYRMRWRGFEMFEETVLDAVKLLVFFFWFTLGFAIIWGALWLKAAKKGRA